VAWTFAGPDGAGGTRDVAVAGDTVYAASALGWVSAVDGRTGQAFWSVDLEEAAWPPSVSDELVIYGTRGYFGVAPRDGPYGAGHVVALRRSDGNEVWRFPLPDSSGYMLSGGAVNGGVVWQDRVIVGGLSSHVYALRLADGELLWQKASGRSPPVASYRRLPVIVGETVVLPRHDNFVEARDVRTGDLLWTLDHSSLLMQASVVGDKVYLIDGSITIIDAQGHVWWQFGGGNVGGRSYWHGSVAPDGMIYTFCKEYLIYGRHTNICAIRPPVSP
jgi:outer membrane protein assembly factor BamB